VIPKSLQNQILEELHQGHFGMVKMKNLARSHVYWEGIDKDIEEYVRHCESCLKFGKMPKKEQIHPWEYPSGPWQRVHVDFAGPFLGQNYFLVVDAYSKWPEIFPVQKITTEVTIKKLEECFSRWGFCKCIVSDNGSAFVSEEFQKFLMKYGIKHVRTAPFHPSSNGQAERYVGIFKDNLRKVMNSGGTIHSKLLNFLLHYRRSPQITTGLSPAVLMLNREITTSIDFVHPESSKEHVFEKQRKMVQLRNKTSNFESGSTVTFKNFGKIGDPWIQGTVVKRNGNVMYDIESNGKIFRRHADQIKNSAVKMFTRQNEDNFKLQSTSNNHQPVLDLDNSSPHDSSKVSSKNELALFSPNSQQQESLNIEEENNVEQTPVKRLRKPPDRYTPSKYV